jgi:hypothetical protein
MPKRLVECHSGKGERMTIAGAMARDLEVFKVELTMMMEGLQPVYHKK